MCPQAWGHGLFSCNTTRFWRQPECSRHLSRVRCKLRVSQQSNSDTGPGKNSIRLQDAVAPPRGAAYRSHSLGCVHCYWVSRTCSTRSNGRPGFGRASVLLVCSTNLLLAAHDLTKRKGISHLFCRLLGAPAEAGAKFQDNLWANVPSLVLCIVVWSTHCMSHILSCPTKPCMEHGIYHLACIVPSSHSIHAL